MTRRKSLTNAEAALAAGGAEAAAPPPDIARPMRPDTTALDVEALAKIILAREVKPRVGEVRRLAEAVLRKKDRKRAKKAMKAAGRTVASLAGFPRARVQNDRSARPPAFAAQ